MKPSSYGAKILTSVTLMMLLALTALAACNDASTPTATISPLRLPTRIPPTPTATPIGPQVYHQAGQDYRSSGDSAAALEAYSTAIATDPDFSSAYRERGSLYLALGDYQAALADAQNAIAADPESGPAYALLGEVLRSGFNDPVQALTAYERAVVLDRDLAEVTFPDRWICAAESNQPNRMLSLANEYLNAHPEDPLNAYYRARAFDAAGNTMNAMSILSETLVISDSAALWFALGDLYADVDAWEYARSCYEQARTLTELGDNSLALIMQDPTSALFGALGTAYLNTGRCSDARNMLNYALAVGQDQLEYHTLLGRAMICLTPTPTPTPYPWLAR